MPPKARSAAGRPLGVGTTDKKAEDDQLEASVKALFKAYDIDESGELSRDEFIKIEMRMCFERGEVFKEQPETAKMTLADADRSGCLSFQEFRERQLRKFSEMGMTKAEIIGHMSEMAKAALAERQKMGPRYHAGVRHALKRIFNLYDTSGDGTLSPEEWIAAQKTVAIEIQDELDEAWIDEAAFTAADTNRDGRLQMGEFLEASFRMFEASKQRSDALMATLDRVVVALEKRRSKQLVETEPVVLFVQSSAQPDFRAPSLSWQDESTEDEPDKHKSAWMECGTIRLPVNLTSVEEVASLLRLVLQKDKDTWLSVFFCAPSLDGGPHPVTLVRGERPGEGNVQSALDYLSKPNAAHRLFVKNMRKKPTRLTRQPLAFLEEREGLVAKKTGQCWGLDWETQLVDGGSALPLLPLVIYVGDAIVIEVPTADDSSEYRYVNSVFMDGTEVLSKPCDETIEKKSKKKRGKAANAPQEDPMVQMSFIALQEGKCVLFVDLSWEDQEEKLCKRYHLVTPCAENTVARIGPIEVDVQKPPVGANREKGTFVWWNGEKWSNKKGPAKKKKRKR